MELFRGSDIAHGTYRPNDGAEDTQRLSRGKIEIRSTARTVREPASESMWEDHLRGKFPLGVIPIMSDNFCWWGCIDVDRYDINHAEMVGEVQKLGLPLWVCKSKSGGAHVFFFVKDKVPASLMREWLGNVAARLGEAESEIFPKQNRLISDRDDVGNWMIMPYFGGTMAGVRSGGGEYTAEEFAIRALNQRADPNLLMTPLPPLPNRGPVDDNMAVEDGPPCLQHLVAAGVLEGSRNNGLFAMATYAKKKWPNGWEEKVEEYNRTSIRPPLSSEEVLGVIKNLKRKDYEYQCKMLPLVNHCNSKECRMRTFGIGDTDLVPVISSLSVLESEPPLWFMDVNDERVELSTDELIDFKRFQKVCVERLMICFPPVANSRWQRQVAKAMESVVRIEAPPETKVEGHLKELLTDFLTNRQRGRKIEDILNGRPWESEEKRVHYFRLRDLREHINRNTLLRGLTQGQITSQIRNMGGGNTFLNVKGRGMSIFFVPSDTIEEPETTTTDNPPQEAM